MWIAASLRPATTTEFHLASSVAIRSLSSRNVVWSDSGRFTPSRR